MNWSEQLGCRAPMRPVLLALVLFSIAAVAATAPAGAASWCGTDAASEDRLPEGVGGRQIHVIYAFPSDGADRFGAVASPIVSDLAAIDAWWRTQDGSRAPRFDLYPFANCAPGLERLDLSRVQLPHDSAYFQTSVDVRFGRLSGDLGGPPFRFAAPAKKYLVYYDGPVADPRVCGVSTVRPDSGGSFSFAFVFLGSQCPADLGSGGLLATAAAHELTHNLGALVVPGPPHACSATDLGHPCDSDHDLMFPFLRYPLSQLVLDAGHDDYYGHSGTWYDVQDSGWLAHLDVAQPELAVSLAGSTGTGTVTSDLPGIACPAACSIAWDLGAVVTLLAEPDERVRFAGWTGSCAGTDPCAVTMDAAKTVGARFARQVRLHIQVLRRPGSAGSVTSRPVGIACPSTCDDEFDAGTIVRLTARARKGSRFVGWTGACRGRAACSVRLSAARSVRASFRRAT